jgi:hypothetical protein
MGRGQQITAGNRRLAGKVLMKIEHHHFRRRSASTAMPQLGRWARMSMRCFTHLLIIPLVLMPLLAQAKHVNPPAVPAITNNGVRFVVPNDKGLRAYVEAWDVKTRQRLWTKTIFTHWYIPPFGTECMHHEWIKSMVLVKDDLLLTSERGRVYRCNIRTKSVWLAKKARNHVPCRQGRASVGSRTS